MDHCSLTTRKTAARISTPKNNNVIACFGQSPFPTFIETDLGCNLNQLKPAAAGAGYHDSLQAGQNSLEQVIQDHKYCLRKSFLYFGECQQLHECCKQVMTEHLEFHLHSFDLYSRRNLVTRQQRGAELVFLHRVGRKWH